MGSPTDVHAEISDLIFEPISIMAEIEVSDSAFAYRFHCEISSLAFWRRLWR